MSSSPLTDLSRRWPTRWQGPGRATFHLQDYAIDYIYRSRRALVITFDHMLGPDAPPPGRRAGWGETFLARKGLSAMHVKPRFNCWYRGPALEDFFRAFAASGLAERFDAVMTYGGSMGGFGALSFARLAGAQRCLALNPQVHLGPSVRDWETRFQIALRQDWTGELCDIRRQIEHAQTVAIAYDPYHAPDARHVALLGDAPILHLRLPFVEHNIPYLMVAMRIAEPVFDACLDGALDEATFRTLARRRRELLRWRNVLLARAKGRPRLTRIIERRARRLGLP